MAFAFLLQKPSTSMGMLRDQITRISLHIRGGSKLHLSALLRSVFSQDKFFNEIRSPSAALIRAYAREDFAKPSGLLPRKDDASCSAGSAWLLRWDVGRGGLTAPLFDKRKVPLPPKGLCSAMWPSDLQVRRREKGREL